jgi:hypothetical protein
MDFNYFSENYYHNKAQTSRTSIVWEDQIRIPLTMFKFIIVLIQIPHLSILALRSV